MDLRAKLLSDQLTEEEYRELPSKEVQVLWIMRPTRRKIEEAKTWMCVRVFFLVIGTIYYLYRYGDYGEYSPLLVALFIYELGYYSLRKELEEKDYQEKRLLYIEHVDKLIGGSLSA